MGKEKKAMAKETAKVTAASSKMKQNKKALGKDKKALKAARTQVKKAEKKMTKVVKETNSDKIQTKRDAINAAATAKLKAEAKTKKIEAKAAQVSYEKMVAAAFREATEQKNTAQANVVAARQSLDRATQNVADAKASLVRAKHKMKHVVNEIRHQIAETKRRNKEQLREKKGIMFEVVNAENAYKKALRKQKEARKFLQRKKKSGKGVKQAKEALAAANVVVASADLSVTRFRNMEKRRKRRARVTDMRAINAGKKAAMLKVDESKSAVASAEEKQRGAQKNLRNALRLRDDANNAWVTAQKGMAAYSKGGKKGELNLAGDWKKISAAFGNSPRVKALNPAVTSAVEAPGAAESAKVNALNSKIKASLKNAPKAMGHTEKAQLGKIKELEAQTKKLQSKKSNDVAALAKDLKQFKSEFREMKSHIAKHIKTPYAKAHGHAAGGKPQTATLKKGVTTIKVKKVTKAPRVKKVTKAQVSKTKALRAKARAVLRKEGKAIPKTLKKGSLDKMMKQKRVQTTPELGENDEFNSKDLDSEAKGLKADLDRIAKHTDMKHLHAASAIAEVTITDDEVAKGKREAQKDAALVGAIKQAAVDPKKEAFAEKKVAMAAHAALTEAQKIAAARGTAYQHQLAKVTVAADAAAKAQHVHAKHLAKAKARVDRHFAALKQERATMSHYTVTDNLHHPDAFLEVAEEQDGDTVAKMKKALQQTKKDAAKEVAQAQQNAVLAITKVKAQVAQLQAQQKAAKEMSQKKVASEVRHVASKAMLAVNAAKVAGALTTGASPATAKVADDGKKQKLIEQMNQSRATAEKAAHVWKKDAIELADMEKAKVAQMKREVAKAKGYTAHASNDVKLSEQITNLFKKVPSVAKKAGAGGQ